MDLNNSLPESEGRPSLAIRVGFVGHRDIDGCEVSLLQATIRSILKKISAQLNKNYLAWGYAETQPVFYLINSLAEGADQVAAEVSQQIDNRYILRIPVPFEPEVYTGYFEYECKQSRDIFKRLSGISSASVINISSPHATKQERSTAYRETASLLLENSDILIAVCDFNREMKRGGTIETVRRAEKVNIPVVHIDSKSPDKVKLIICDKEKTNCELPIDQLEQQLCNILAPHFSSYPSDEAPYYPNIPNEVKPGLKDRFCQCLTGKEGIVAEEEKKSEQIRKRERFFNEVIMKKPDNPGFFSNVLKWIYRPWWRSIHNVGEVSVYIRHFLIRCVEKKQEENIDSRQFINEGSVECLKIRRLQKSFKKYHERIDKVSVYYMDLYRGAFVLNYLMGAMAVLFALLSYFNPVREALWLWCEVAALAVIAVNFLANRFWHWNERAIEYRFLAEHFRHMEMLVPLVRVTPLTRMSVHNNRGDPDVTWMNWFFRSIVRENGLIGENDWSKESLPTRPVVNMSQDYLEQIHAILKKDWLEEQHNYHEHFAHRFEFISKVFRVITITLFVMTVTACLLHLFHVDLPLEVSIATGGEWRPGWLLTITVAALPAFLAAFHGITKQAEFERLIEQSEAMAEHLERIIKRFSNMQLQVTSSTQLGNMSVDIAKMMLEETLEWRVMYLAHETELT